MKNFYSEVKAFYPSVFHFNIAMLLFRAAVATEMIRVHGLKKIGIGVAEIENVPNPYHLPEFINHASAIASDFFFPLMVIAGLLTRLAVLPSLVVTLTGFFIMHWNDTPAAQDMPFMYSVAFLLILIVGPGKYSADFLIQQRKYNMEN